MANRHAWTTLLRASCRPSLRRVLDRGASSAAAPRAPLSSLLTVALATALISSGVTYALASPAPAPAQPAPKSPAQPGSADLASCLAELRWELADDAIGVGIEDLRTHGWAEWSEHAPEILPGAVVYPSSIEDVVAIVKAAARFRVPLIPYGGATSIEVRCPSLARN